MEKIEKKIDWFKIAIIVFLLWFTWNIHTTKTQKYYYNIEFVRDMNVYDILTEYGDMGCIIDSSRRATSEGSIYGTEVGYEFVVRCPK